MSRQRHPSDVTLATLRDLLDHLPVGVGVVDVVEADGVVRPDAPILYYNREWVRLFGFDVADVVDVAGATARLYPDPAVRAEMVARRRAAALRHQENGAPEQFEARAMGASGQWVDVLTGTSVAGGRMIVTMLDITRARRAEAALEAALRVALHRAGSPRRMVSRSAIVAVVAEGKHSRVFAADGVHADHRGLSEWERLLEAEGFVRLDRSTLARPASIASVELVGRGARLGFHGVVGVVELGRVGRSRLDAVLGGRGA